MLSCLYCNEIRIRKQAILIGHSGNEEEHLPGVEIDIEKYPKFLMSPYGGA